MSILDSNLGVLLLKATLLLIAAVLTRGLLMRASKGCAGRPGAPPCR